MAGDAAAAHILSHNGDAAELIPDIAPESETEPAEPAKPFPCRRRAVRFHSVIDAFNARHGVEELLTHYGYVRAAPGKYSRPGREGGVSASVTVRDGRSFHFSTNDPLHGTYWRRPFHLYCQLEHGGDVRRAVRLAATQMGMSRVGGTSQRQQQGGRCREPIAVPLIANLPPTIPCDIGGSALAISISPNRGGSHAA